ncbi:hypothetical protein GYMLUDRAFT_530903 [Collybiopsis luxurians FD-317 M1]|nr:hypothetical protein GYMLUDRAFT_530903 [Collybiopsis luxurians FD-317 M1]
MLEVLGTPFRLQQFGPSAIATVNQTPNLSASTDHSTPSAHTESHSKNHTMVAGTTTPPRTPPQESLGGSGDERSSPSPKSRGRGKGKNREISSSRTSSPLRNVTPPSAATQSPVPPLPPFPSSRPPSRPSTPLRSAMASSSRFEPIPLAPSTSAGSLGKGKRKADEVDGVGDDATVNNSTPSLPEIAKQHQRTVYRATFAAEPRMHRTSTSSYNASHYTRRKRARISSGTSFATTQTVSENGVVRIPSSRAGSRNYVPYNGTATPSIRPSSRVSRTPTQSSLHGAGSTSSRQHRNGRYVGQPQRVRGPPSTRSSKRNSISTTQASIPISALISPHAPSISVHRSTAYHMRDPRKPNPVHPTSWSLAFPSAGPEERGWFSGCRDAVASFWGFRGLRGKLFGSRLVKAEDADLEKQPGEENGGKLPVVHWVEGGGSPIHAWLFFLGFILFPVWWIAGLFVGIPKTRRLGKSVVLDDPQVEHDAKSWRNRCRVMIVVSLFTYVPFIVLVTIFVPRS